MCLHEYTHIGTCWQYAQVVLARVIGDAAGKYPGNSITFKGLFYFGIVYFNTTVDGAVSHERYFAFDVYFEAAC